jgi:hypothetical protein
MRPVAASFVLPAVLVVGLVASLGRIEPNGILVALLLLAIWVAAFWFEAIRQEATMRTIFQAD